jgi:hypothetical protein
VSWWFDYFFTFKDAPERFLKIGWQDVGGGCKIDTIKFISGENNE